MSVAAGGGGGGGPPISGGWGWPSNGGGRSAAFAGCVYMPRFACTNNPFCTIDQDGNCAPSGQAPPYEEFDEEVDYDSFIDEEDEVMASEDYDLDAYDMAAEE